MVDTFLLSCSVRYAKQDYQNRVKVRGQWLTIPVKKPVEVPLNQLQIVYQPDLIRKTLLMAYGGKKWRYRERLEKLLSHLNQRS